MKRWQALAALLLVVLIWGSTFVIVRNTTKELETFHLLFYRFLIGALSMLPFALPSLRRATKRELHVGVALGALLFISFSAQTEGLSLTSAARGGFITGLNVVLVPALGALFFKERITRTSWLGVAFATGGLLLLTRCGDPGGFSWVGDLLVLLCAFAFAAHILAVDRIHALTGPARNNAIPADEKPSLTVLTVLQLATVSTLALLCSVVSNDLPPMPSGAGLLSLTYLGAIASALILALQLPAQRVVSATETALIFSLEPVFAALFAIFLGEEQLCLGFWLGGLFMLLGLLTCELGKPKNVTPQDGSGYIRTDENPRVRAALAPRQPSGCLRRSSALLPPLPTRRKHKNEMTIQTILQRKLTPRGCIAVSQALSDNWMILREQEINPPPEVEAAAERVYDAGNNLSQLGEDISMANVDQGTDRMIAGFFGIFSAREMCYTAEQILPISPEEKDWLRLSYKTKITLFPNGTKFVQEAHENQWKHLERLQDLLTSQEIQSALYSLSLTAEASRLLRWIELYGIRIGALQSQRDQQVRAALAAFYEAWDYFSVEVLHAYRDHSPESKHATNALLSIYDEQVEKEEEAILQSSGLKPMIKK